MASLPFVQGSVAGITHVRKVDDRPQTLVSIIEGHLVSGLDVLALEPEDEFLGG